MPSADTLAQRIVIRIRSVGTLSICVRIATVAASYLWKVDNNAVVLLVRASEKEKE